MTMTKTAERSALKFSEHIRSWPTPRSKNWTTGFLDEAGNDNNIIAVVAVGSTVRPAVNSVDLDLIVICREPAELKAKPPIEIDFRKYQVGRVNEQITQGNDLLGWAVKYGRILFQRESYWDRIVESWRDRLPLPSADISDKRASEAFRRLTNVFEVGDVDAAHEQALSYATHLARTELLKRKVYPASRPELPGQLRSVGIYQIADFLERLIDQTADNSQLIGELVKSRS
jgi:hypothetical protein